MKSLKFSFVGGDLRLAAAHFYIKEAGYLSDTFLLEKAENLPPEEKCIIFPKSDVYVLPLPITVDGKTLNSPMSDLSLLFSDFFNLIPKDAVIFGGLIPDNVKALAADYGITCYDYYDSEELQVKNAVPTSEGAIEIALRELPVTLFGTKSLVTGYGRIGKVIAPMLKALGSNVTVATRSKDSRIWSEISGFPSIDTALISELVNDFDLIINTAPVKLFTGEILKNLKKDTLLIDLASRPGGVDMDEASLLGIRVIWALGLPGKCAPVSAGRIIGSTVLNTLSL